MQLIRCAVLGSPIAHSLSPVIHRAAYAWLGLDWSYDAIEVDAEGFATFVDGLDASWRGLSCTMPLKEVAAACGTPDDDVVLTGAANTVVLDPAGRRVHNTDIAGFADALAGQGVTAVRTAVILGNGSTARSALVALQRCGVRWVEVAGRDPARVAAFRAWAGSLPVEVRSRRWGSAVDPAAELLVSTIPSAALAPVLPGLRIPRAMTGAGGRLRAVFDVSYHPWPTPLAGAAEAAGLTVLSGLELLIHQARHQVRLMTGRIVPVEVLASAVQEALRLRTAT